MSSGRPKPPKRDAISCNADELGDFLIATFERTLEADERKARLTGRLSLPPSLLDGLPRPPAALHFHRRVLRLALK